MKSASSKTGFTVVDLNINFFDYDNNELVKKSFQSGFSKWIFVSCTESYETKENSNNWN